MNSLPVQWLLKLGWVALTVGLLLWIGPWLASGLIINPYWVSLVMLMGILLGEKRLVPPQIPGGHLLPAQQKQPVWGMPDIFVSGANGTSISWVHAATSPGSLKRISSSKQKRHLPFRLIQLSRTS